MQTKHLVAGLLGLATVALFAADASAFYNPSLGRWMQRDPGPDGMMAPPRLGTAGPAAGEGFFPHDPTGQYRDGRNFYEYVASQPTVFLDPAGLKQIKYSYKLMMVQLTSEPPVPPCKLINKTTLKRIDEAEHGSEFNHYLHTVSELRRLLPDYGIDPTEIGFTPATAGKPAAAGKPATPDKPERHGWQVIGRFGINGPEYTGDEGLGAPEPDKRELIFKALREGADDVILFTDRLGGKSEIEAPGGSQLVTGLARHTDEHVILVNVMIGDPLPLVHEVLHHILGSTILTANGYGIHDTEGIMKLGVGSPNIGCSTEKALKDQGVVPGSPDLNQGKRMEIDKTLK